MKTIKKEINSVLILKLRKVRDIDEEEYSIYLEKYSSKIEHVIEVKYNGCESK